MKLFLKLFLIMVPIFGFSAIDECKTDVYFANGILTKEKDAIKNADLLEKNIKQEVYANNDDKMYTHIGKVDYAYNRTDGNITDLLESVMQKVDGSLIDKVKYFDLLTLIGGLLTKDSHDEDLDLQVTKYKNSISDGHKVLVVAHSQGNLFTGEAYTKLDNWMKDYFEVVSIASPRHDDIKSDTPRINWDNDLVAYLALLNNGWIDNSVRRVSWDLSKPYIQGEDTPSKRPTENYVLNSEVNKIYKEWWIGTEGWLEKLDSNVHAFTFYMGLPLKNGETNKVFINPFTNKNLIDSSARSKIMTAIKTKLDLLDTIDSQWKTNKESDKNTCNYRITVKHRFDPSIEVGGTVYPFNGAKKLYQVNGEYVKASCGGENILSAWDGKKDNECWMIDNVEEEKIVEHEGRRFIRDDDKGIVLDTNTSLVWQDNIIISKRWLTLKNWYARDYFDTSGDTATTYCENLALGGYGDWRLPSRIELLSVSRPNRFEMKIEILKSFKFMHHFYWSSTTTSPLSNAWRVNFSCGYDDSYGKHDGRYVRCVRAGQ